MRPRQRFAIDVFLEQTLTHHQSEIAARTAPRGISGLVDDMTQVVQPAGRCRLSGSEPRFAGLAALPRLGGEAKDLDLHTTAFQGSGKDVGAGRGHCYRTSAHGAGVVDQQRDDCIAEIGVALLLEGKR